MDRREVLKISSIILGYTVVGGTAISVLNGCKADASTDWTPSFLTSDEAKLVAEITETILPATDTPGAKEALCERYIDQVVYLFYTPENQTYFRESLGAFDKAAKVKYSKAFVALNANEKENVLEILSKEMAGHDDEGGKKPHIMKTMKELTVTGYCTSEVGAKGGLLDFRPVPGPYQGCIEYSTIGKAWLL